CKNYQQMWICCKKIRIKNRYAFYGSLSAIKLSFISIVILVMITNNAYVLASTTNVVSSSSDYNNSANNNTTNIDKFGIKEIYPTKQGGREWYINMGDPRSDGLFFITSDPNITRQSDGSWRIDVPKVRMNVDTPPGTELWKNVEITGYFKVISIIDPKNETDVAWYARGGRHSDEAPCEGTALIGGIHTDGSVGWKKEIWFTGGYTDERGTDKVVTNPMVGRWIGWKVIMYNINNDTAVKMESYIDNTDTNYWIQVTNLTDSGGWYAKTSDGEFYSVDCGKPKDYIITNGGPLVTFRTDNVIWDFKNLSVREITPELGKIYNPP
ncbi:MAG: hypothetical protein M3250_03080, partial [Thermoproteota archaeon]|nr:hypothetical protein [Thermoproteota archaeon]